MSYYIPSTSIPFTINRILLHIILRERRAKVSKITRSYNSGDKTIYFKTQCSISFCVFRCGVCYRRSAELPRIQMLLIMGQRVLRLDYKRREGNHLVWRLTLFGPSCWRSRESMPICNEDYRTRMQRWYITSAEYTRI